MRRSARVEFGLKRRMGVLKTGAAIMVLALPGMAFAQQAETQQGSTQLETITVEGNAETPAGPVKGYAAKKSATGSKSDTAIKSIPQSVSVLGREEMTDRGVTNKMDEALRYTAGVSAEPFGADPDTDWVYIRGFDASQTGLFLDSLNMYSFAFGGFQVDPYFLERVEVLKGPASVLYGAANPGGLVNMVGKRPTGEKHLDTEIGINNYGNAFFGFDAGDVLMDDVVSYRVTGKLAGGSQKSDFSKDFRGGIMPQVSWTPDEGTKLNVYGFYSALDQVHTGNGFLPYVGTVVDAPFGRIPRTAFYGEPGLDHGEYQQTMIGYEFEHEFENGISFEQNARYAHLDKYEIGPYPFGYYDAGAGTNYNANPVGPTYMLSRAGFEGKSKVDSFSIDNRVNAEFETGALTHDLTLGLDYKYYRLDEIQNYPTFPVAGTPIAVIDPVYGAVQPVNDPQKNHVLTQQQLGIYVQDQIRFGGGWLTTINGRYDFVNSKLSSRLAGGYSYDKDDQAASGRIGVAYEFANGVTPYASASTFFTPIIATSATTPIKPEKGYQVEAGVKYEPAAINGLFTASVFHLVKKNWTVSLPVAPFTTSQIGEVTSTGLELEGKFDITDDLKALGSFTYQHLEMTEHINAALIGKSPYTVPKMSASAWLDYTIPTGMLEGVSLAGGLRYQGESWADYANTYKVPGALVADAAIRWEKDGWGASLNVTNLFDKVYVKGCQTTLTCGYGEARTVSLKLTKSW